MKEERHKIILEEINLHNKAHSSDLSKRLNVSEDTIRRDLKELANSGQIEKVHGGAIVKSRIVNRKITEEVPFREERLVIAKKALSLIHDQKVIMIEGDKSNLVFAEQIPKDFAAVIITNSLPIAAKLYEHPSLEIIFLGGKVSHKSKITTGMDVINSLNDLHVDICFIETSGIHPTIGLTDEDREKAMIKKAMIKASDRLVALSLSEAIDKVQPFKIESINQVQTVISELDADHEKLLNFKEKGINVL